MSEAGATDETPPSASGRRHWRLWHLFALTAFIALGLAFWRTLPGLTLLLFSGASGIGAYRATRDGCPPLWRGLTALAVAFSALMLCASPVHPIHQLYRQPCEMVSGAMFFVTFYAMTSNLGASRPRRALFGCGVAFVTVIATAVLLSTFFPLRFDP